MLMIDKVRHPDRCADRDTTGFLTNGLWSSPTRKKLPSSFTLFSCTTLALSYTTLPTRPAPARPWPRLSDASRSKARFAHLPATITRVCRRCNSSSLTMPWPSSPAPSQRCRHTTRWADQAWSVLTHSRRHPQAHPALWAVWELQRVSTGKDLA